jgi:hypothetical protein
MASSSLESLLASIAPQLKASAGKVASGTDAKADLFRTLLDLVSQSQGPAGMAASSNGTLGTNIPSNADLAMQLLDALTASEGSLDRSRSTSVIPDFQLPAKLQAYAEIEKLGKSTDLTSTLLSGENKN